MRHVLVLTTSYPRFDGDPAGHFVESAVNALLAEGADVSVFLGGAPPTHRERPDSVAPSALPPEPPLQAPRRQAPRLHALGGALLFSSPGVLARLRQNPLRLALLAPVGLALWREARRLPPVDQVVMHWLLPSAFPGLLLLQMAGLDLSRARLECILHGSDARLLSSLPRPLRTRVLRYLRARGVALTFVSDALRETVRATLPHDPALASWIAESGVAPAPLGELPPLERDAARASIDVPSEARVFVVVGRLVTSKRARHALAALSCIPDAHIVVVGDGPDRPALECDYPEARFVGALPRSEALTWIAAADCLVSASTEEGAPTVVREARALGAFVVTRNVGDVGEWAKRDPGIFVIG